MAKKTYFNWSTGKDSAMALKRLMEDEAYSVEHLLISVNNHHDRVSMHGLRRELMEQQMHAIGIPFSTVELSESPTMEEYAAKMSSAVQSLKKEGFTHAGFGDICLEDLRKYREEQLAMYDITAVFPLWRIDTHTLMEEFLASNFQAITVCTKADLLDEDFCGRIVDSSFIDELPKKVDPCGENGEFHTFCYAGDIFDEPIPFSVGEKVYREYNSPESDSTEEKDEQEVCQEAEKMGFWYCELLSDIEPSKLN